MKRVICSLIFLCTILQADEVETLENLIRLTRQQLEREELALDHLKAFHKARNDFLKSNDDPLLGTRMVRRAMELYELVDKAHLSHIFSPELLEELAFFNDMGQAHHLKR